MAGSQDSIPDAPPEWPGYAVETRRLKTWVRHVPVTDKPTLVLLHGLAVHGGMYEGGMRRELSEHFDVVVPDLRGHGLTEAPPGAWEIEDFADDIEALLDAMDRPRAHILGYSMGGFVAQSFAQRHPDRVDRLVLLCTAPRQARGSMRVGLGLLEGLFRVVPPAAMLPISRRLLSGPGMPPEMRYVLPWLLQHNTRRGISGSARALRRADLRDGLGRITHRTLLVTAEHDAALPKLAWQPLLDALDDVHHEHFDDAGHGLAASHGARLGELVRAFLSDLDDPGTP